MKARRIILVTYLWNEGNQKPVAHAPGCRWAKETNSRSLTTLEEYLRRRRQHGQAFPEDQVERHRCLEVTA